MGGRVLQGFFLTFIYQYIAFKTRNPDYLALSKKKKESFAYAIEVSCKEGLEYLVEDLEGIEMAINRESVDYLWSMVRNAPRSLATRRNEFIVQIIDEFQYLNSEIYRDKDTIHRIDDFAAG